MATSDLSIVINAKNEASKVFKDVEKSAGSMGKALADVGKIAAGFVVGSALTKLPGLFTSVVSAASDMNESVSKGQTVFGQSFAQVDKFAETAAKSMGMSRQAALEATGTFGNFLQAMGTGQKPAADMSAAMVQLAADLGSFNNTSADEALLALRSGLSGEAEPMRKFGVALSETAVKAKELEMGMKPVGKEFTEQQKIMARYQIIMDQTKVAQGDYERTSGGLANTMKSLGATVDDLKAKVGGALLPVVLQVAQALQAAIPVVEGLAAQYIPMLTEAFGQVLARVQPLIDQVRPFFESLAQNQQVIQTAATVIGGILVAALGAATLALAGFVGGLLLTAAPIVALGAAIGAAALGVRYLIENWDSITAQYPQITAAINAVRDAFAQAADFAKERWAAFTEYFNTQLGPALENVKSVVVAVLTYIVDLFRQHLPAMQAIVEAAVADITAKFNLVSGVVGDVIILIVDLINGDWAKAWADAKQLISDAVDGMVDVAQKQIALVVAVFTGVGGLIVTALKDLGDTLYKAGLAAGKQFAKGIQDGIASVPGKLLGIAGSAIGSLAAPIGAHGDGNYFAAKPELAVIGDNPEGEYVLTPSQLRAYSGAGGGQNITNINVYGSILSEREVLRIVRDAQAGGGLYGVA